MKLFATIVIALALPLFAQAEEKNCTVKGMHCDACTDQVKEKVCNEKFEVCDLTLKNKVGTLHLKTKDAAGKIDAKALTQAMADTTYKVEKCTELKGKSTM